MALHTAELCSLQQWQPRYLDTTGEDHHQLNRLPTRQICTGRRSARPLPRAIKIAKALDLHSVEQLVLKAAALSLLQSQNKADPSTLEAATATNLLSALDLHTRHWAPHFQLHSGNRTTGRLTRHLEAEAARNNGCGACSMVGTHGCPSLWILHNKALALSHLQSSIWPHPLGRADCRLPAFVAVAEQAFRASEQREQSIQSTLLEALIGRIQQNHLQPQVLPASGELSDDADFKL